MIFSDEWDGDLRGKAGHPGLLFHEPCCGKHDIKGKSDHASLLPCHEREYLEKLRPGVIFASEDVMPAGMAAHGGLDVAPDNILYEYIVSGPGSVARDDPPFALDVEA